LGEDDAFILKKFSEIIGSGERDVFAQGGCAHVKLALVVLFYSVTGKAVRQTAGL
jgi:hypothetical protein